MREGEKVNRETKKIRKERNRETDREREGEGDGERQKNNETNGALLPFSLSPFLSQIKMCRSKSINCFLIWFVATGECLN